MKDIASEIKNIIVMRDLKTGKKHDLELLIKKNDGKVPSKHKKIYQENV